MSPPYRRFFTLCGVLLTLLGCLAHPEQLDSTQPYALLVLPEAIQLLALDTQTIDNRVRGQELRVTPGAHSLRFAYVGDSPQHTGQRAEPFQLYARSGHRYVFEAKT